MVQSVFIKRDAATCPSDSFANVPTDGCEYVADIAKCASSECKWNVSPSKVRLYLLGPDEEEESALHQKCLDSRLTLLAANIEKAVQALSQSSSKTTPPSRVPPKVRAVPAFYLSLHPYPQLSVPRFLQLTLPRGLTRPVLGSFKLFGLGFVCDLWGAKGTP